eukprot:gene12768-14745_t
MSFVSSLSYPPPNMLHPSTQNDLEAGVTHNMALGADEIDVDFINRSLEHVNNFAKRYTEKLPQVLMYEMNTFGDSSYKSMTLRELLQYVNEETEYSGYFDCSAGTRSSVELRRSNSSSKIHSGRKENNRKHDARIAGDTRSIRTQPPHMPEPSSADSTFVSAIGDLRLRDLRRLDYQFNPNEERSVLIRRHSVLFAMDPLRAVVMADRLILIVPDGADSLISILDKYMHEWVLAKRTLAEMQRDEPLSAHSKLRFNSRSSSNGPLPSSSDPHATSVQIDAQDGEDGGDVAMDVSVDSTYSNKGTTSTASTRPDGENPSIAPSTKMLRRAMTAASDLPFEVHAYEALLTTVTVLETQEFNRVNAQVQVILGYFRSGSLLPIEIQEQMRNRKNDLCVMLSRIRSARHTIHELTEDDEDM